MFMDFKELFLYYFRGCIFTFHIERTKSGLCTCEIER
jgi:hypothetical protein